jgi:hypothetical protein
METVDGTPAVRYDMKLGISNLAYKKNGGLQCRTAASARYIRKFAVGQLDTLP